MRITIKKEDLIKIKLRVLNQPIYVKKTIHKSKKNIIPRKQKHKCQY